MVLVPVKICSVAEMAVMILIIPEGECGLPTMSMGVELPGERPGITGERGGWIGRGLR